MSKTKAIKVLESLGGKAEIVAIRNRARKMYPDTQLWRIIHTPLKRLQEEEIVRSSGKHGHTVWTIRGYKPPLTTADQLLTKKEEDKDKDKDKPIIAGLKAAAKYTTDLDEKEFRKLIDSAGPPIPEPIINNNTVTTTVDPEIKKTENGVLSIEIEKALKEPYLDKLAGLAKNVAEKEYKYRGRHDIVFDILRYMRPESSFKFQLGHGVKIHGITDIMYKTMLSHFQLKKYMVILLKNDLVKKLDTGYIITDKGQHYSETMDSIPIEF